MALRLLMATFFLTCLACATRSTTPAESVVPSQGDGTASLTVEVLGLESDMGSVAVAVFDSPESFEERSAAVAAQTVAPQGGRAIWSVADLPTGNYAVAVYHDLNDNGELDRSTLGPPSEPYGFSNDARGTFGPPKFSSAAFELPPGQLTIQIRVH